MPFIDLASFPNSRIKPRPATRECDIKEQIIPANTPTLVSGVVPERTYITIYDQSLTSSLRYLRGTSTNISTEGFLLGADRAVDLEGPQDLWVWSLLGTTISVDEGIG
jgi:hypothetical protein